MSRGLVKHGRRAFWAAILALGFGGAASAGTVIINANTAYPGGESGQYGDFIQKSDTFFNSGYLGLPGAGSSNPAGWYYSNVRADTTVGINTMNARSGNGSAYFNTTTGTGKADVEYKPGGSIGGTLSQLNSFGYDWYRDGDSGNSSVQVPALRLLLQKGADSKYLVYEPVWNGYPYASPPPTNQWMTADAYSGGNAKFWIQGDANQIGYSLSSYMAAYGDYNVVGFNVGVGSGWNGNFVGAADNIRIGFTGGEETTYNFEVSGVPAPAVPEPSSVAMGLIAGAAGLVMAARRRRSA